MKSIKCFFIVSGIAFAFLSALFFAAAFYAQWGKAPPFDVLGLLPLLGNIGSLFAYFWASLFAAGAIGCWIRAAFMT